MSPSKERVQVVVLVLQKHPALCIHPGKGRTSLPPATGAGNAPQQGQEEGGVRAEEGEMSVLEAAWLFSPPLPGSYPLRIELQKAVIYRELQLWQGQPGNVLGHGGVGRKQLPTFPTAATALLGLPALSQQGRQKGCMPPTLSAHPAVRITSLQPVQRGWSYLTFPHPTMQLQT